MGICFAFADLGYCQFGSNCRFRHVPEVSERLTSSPSLSPIDAFFASYSDFAHDLAGQVWEEFDRLCACYNWDEKDYDMRQARREFKSAMLEEFECLYGRDTESIKSWQNLCQLLAVEPIPNSLEDCRREVLRLHVNLVDLVDFQRTGIPVAIFPDLASLREYTISTGKFFPRDKAKAHGPLRYLLRGIF